MSDPTTQTIADALETGVPNLLDYVGGLWLIAPPAWNAGKMLAARTDWTAHMAAWNGAKAAMPEGSRVQRRTYAVNGGVAEMDMRGTLAPKEFSLTESTSTIALGRSLDLALQDPEVDRVMVTVDSPGGLHAGTEHLADTIQRVNAKKPVGFFATGMCCSAAYWLASQGCMLDAVPGAWVANIGCIMSFLDDSEMMAALGLKEEHVASGPFKTAGYTFPMTPEHKAYWQGMVDSTHREFVHAVAKGRGMTVPEARALADGKAHTGRKAMRLGLVDSIGSYEDAMNRLKRYDPAKPETAPKSAKENVRMKLTMEDIRAAFLGGAKPNDDDELEVAPTAAVEPPKPAATTEPAAHPLVAACAALGITDPTQLNGLKSKADLSDTALEDVKTDAKAMAVIAYGAEAATATYGPMVDACATYGHAKAMLNGFTATAQEKHKATKTEAATRVSVAGALPDVNGGRAVAVDAGAGDPAKRREELLNMTPIGREAAKAEANGK